MVTIIENTQDPLNVASFQLHQDLYTGDNFKDYVIAAVCKTDENVDAIYAFELDEDDNPIYYLLVDGLTKYRRYTFAILNNRVYVANGVDPIKWIHCDGNGDFTSGDVINAPIGEYLIASKNRLFLGGKTFTDYNTGTAQFTNGDATVNGAGTAWLGNLRAGDQIGTGAIPTKYYTVKDVVSDTQVELSTNYDEPSTGMVAYNVRRITDDVVYYSAEMILDQWDITGYQGGEDQGFLQIGRKNTGLHDYNDSVVLPSDIDVHYLAGTNIADWQVPPSTRIPVGCTSHYSLVSHHQVMGFNSDRGFYMTSGGNLSFSSLDAEPYSFNITSVFRTIDDDRKDWVQCSVYDEFLFINIPSTEVYDADDRELGYQKGRVNVYADSKEVHGIGTNWLGFIWPDDEIQFEEGGDWFKIKSVVSGIKLEIHRIKNETEDYLEGTYKIRKRRGNRLIVLDSRTNMTKRRGFGWTIFDDINANGFVIYKNKLLYGSATSGYIWEYNKGGRLYGREIIARAKTKLFTGGSKYTGITKYFKGLWLRAKGVGIVYITPIVDGEEGTRIYHEFNTPDKYEEVYFPKTNNPFCLIGSDIELLIECTGKDEDIVIMPPTIGFLPVTRKNVRKRM